MHSPNLTKDEMEATYFALYITLDQQEDEYPEDDPHRPHGMIADLTHSLEELKRVYPGIHKKVYGG